MFATRAILTSSLLFLLFNAAQAQNTAQSAGVEVKVPAPFAIEEAKRKRPRGISGLACLGSGESERHCLTVNDEERFLEWATLTLGTQGAELKPSGHKMRLLTKSEKQEDIISGSQPKKLCKAQDDEFSEFDGEAISISGNFAYTIGSHSCSRTKGEFKPSSFILARAPAAFGDLQPAQVERTWRVADLIARSSLKEKFGKVLPDGISIEGIAVSSGKIVLGFRTPAEGKLYFMRSDVEPLFVAGEKAGELAPEEITVPVPANVGVRDLAAIADGRILVLTGPGDSSRGAYVVHVLDWTTQALTPLVEVVTPQKGRDRDNNEELAKAEGIAVLSEQGREISMLVVYDNNDDGGPRLHKLALPEAKR